jgi:hypothetical protein
MSSLVATLTHSYDKLLGNNLATSLDLHIGSLYMASFARLLARNTSLTALCLDDSAIDDAGAEALATALAVHPALCHLSLLHNRIGDRGVGHLSAALAVGPPLTFLDIRFNAYTEAGLSGTSASPSFPTSVRAPNTTLRLMWASVVWGVGVGVGGGCGDEYTVLSTALATNTRLTALEAHASTTSHSWRAIRRILERNICRATSRRAQQLLTVLSTHAPQWPTDVQRLVVSYVEDVTVQLIGLGGPVALESDSVAPDTAAAAAAAAVASAVHAVPVVSESAWSSHTVSTSTTTNTTSSFTARVGVPIPPVTSLYPMTPPQTTNTYPAVGATAAVAATAIAAAVEPTQKKKSGVGSMLYAPLRA